VFLLTEEVGEAVHLGSLAKALISEAGTGSTGAGRTAHAGSADGGRLQEEK
jgi:hypothetical protein